MNDKIKVMYSALTPEWETPKDYFEQLDKEFDFTLDVCATKDNAKCKKYFTKEIDGLKQDWSKDICFMNPPYGRVIYDWVQKALKESVKGAIVVCLVPARTDTKWFHDFVLGKAEIRFIKGRLRFENKDNLKFGKSNSAPFPSMLVIYGKKMGLVSKNE